MRTPDSGQRTPTVFYFHALGVSRLQSTGSLFNPTLALPGSHLPLDWMPLLTIKKMSNANVKSLPKTTGAGRWLHYQCAGGEKKLPMLALAILICIFFFSLKVPENYLLHLKILLAMALHLCWTFSGSVLNLGIQGTRRQM